MSITEFEFKARGLLEKKVTKYRNSIPQKAVIELIEEIIHTYSALHGAEIILTPPVQVGDQLYPVWWDHVADIWIIDDEPEQVIEIGTKGFFLASCLQDPDNPDEFHLYDEIGKEFFLTHEEAKTAVEKLREENENG